MMFLFFSDENTIYLFFKSHESKHIQQPMQEKLPRTNIKLDEEVFCVLLLSDEHNPILGSNAYSTVGFCNCHLPTNAIRLN